MVLAKTYHYGRFIALAGAVGVHAGLATWAMQPSDEPEVIKKPSVLQVAMVSVPSPAPAPMQPPKVVQESMKIPPKIQPKAQIVKKAQVQKPLPASKKPAPVVTKQIAKPVVPQQKFIPGQVASFAPPVPSVPVSAPPTPHVQPITQKPVAHSAPPKPVFLPVTAPSFNVAYLNNPAPAYPYAAKRRGTEGKVVLKVHVSKEGRANNVMVSRSSGSDILDDAALNAVRHWKFVPAKKGDEVIMAHVLVPIEFKLN